MAFGPGARPTSPGPAAGNNSFRSRAERPRGGVAKGCHARKAGFSGRTRERASPNNSNDRPDRQREIVHASHRDKRVSGPRRRVVTGCLRYSILPVTRV